MADYKKPYQPQIEVRGSVALNIVGKGVAEFKKFDGTITRRAFAEALAQDNRARSFIVRVYGEQRQIDALKLGPQKIDVVARASSVAVA